MQLTSKPMTLQTQMLTVDRARALLSRMQAAAPPPTADKLGDIAALLDALSAENDYLSSLYDAGLSRSPANGAPTNGASSPEQCPSSDDIRLLSLLEDALRPRLSAVHAAVEPLTNGDGAALSPETKAILRQARDHNRAAQALLDGVETLVALREGLLDVTPLVFSANLLLREAQHQSHDRIQARDQMLTANYPEQELEAVGDYQRVLDILLDLIDNASRYTPRGGHIQLKAESLGTHVLFSVDDNGIGLRPDDEARMGEPFWRATDQPLVRQHAGSGLRLYLARQMLALQDGELIFSGEPGMGSTFSFTLPGA